LLPRPYEKGERRVSPRGPPCTTTGPADLPLITPELPWALRRTPLAMTLETVHLAATLFMTGVIAFVQVVHYPLMARVGKMGSVDYQQAHMRRTAWVVIPAMTMELGSAVGLLVLRWGTPDGPLTLVGGALLGVIWLSTALVQAPLHGRLASGFDAGLHRRLVLSNWVRTAAWGGRVPVAIGLM